MKGSNVSQMYLYFTQGNLANWRWGSFHSNNERIL